MTRDPLERLVSLFEWGKCDTSNRYYWMEGWNPGQPMDFEEWFWNGKMLDRNTREWTESKGIYSVFSFASIDGTVAVDRIYGEHTLDDFADDMSRIVGETVEFPHRNRGPERRQRTLAYFDRAILERVVQDFDYEYSVLGYDLPVLP